MPEDRLPPAAEAFLDCIPYLCLEERGRVGRMLAALLDEVRAEERDSSPWCQPGDVKERQWLLVFEDPDRPQALFANEAEARSAFEQANLSWNCWLFAAAEKIRKEELE